MLAMLHVRLTERELRTRILNPAILRGRLSLTARLTGAAPASPKPNFFVLLGDDLGCGELGLPSGLRA